MTYNLPAGSENRCRMCGNTKRRTAAGTAPGAGSNEAATGGNAKAAGQRLKTAGPGAEVPVEYRL